MKQGSTEWLNARLGGLGGSEVSAMYNANPYLSAFELWARKTRRLPPGEPASPTHKPQLYWGTALEPLVRVAYQEVTGRTVVDGVTMLQHPDVPCLFANTDGEVEATGGSDGPGVYEGKVVTPFMKSAWSDGPPLFYVMQEQHYMACTGLRWSSLAAKIGDDTLYWDVERDEHFISDLCERASRWWDYHVVKDNAPAPDGSKATKAALERVFPEDDGTAVDLAGPWPARIDDLVTVRKRLRELNAIKMQLENELKARIGEATYAKLPDGSGVSLATTLRASYTTKDTSYRAIKVHADIGRKIINDRIDNQ